MLRQLFLLLGLLDASFRVRFHIEVDRKFESIIDLHRSHGLIIHFESIEIKDERRRQTIEDGALRRINLRVTGGTLIRIRTSHILALHKRLQRIEQGVIISYRQRNGWKLLNALLRMSTLGRMSDELIDGLTKDG